MKTILYLGTDPSNFKSDGRIIHYPVIKIMPRSVQTPDIILAFHELPTCSHVIFTSKNAVDVFFFFLTHFYSDRQVLSQKYLIALGRATAARLAFYRFSPHIVGKKETQEGLIELLGDIDLKEAYLFLPRSALSRPKLVNYLVQMKIKHRVCDLYDTIFQELKPVPNLDEIDEVIFTSPSTVAAYLKIYPQLPVVKKIVAIGPITQKALRFFHRKIKRRLV